MTPQLRILIRSLYGVHTRLEEPLPDPTDSVAMGFLIECMWMDCEVIWKRFKIPYNDDATDAFDRLFRPVIGDLIERAQQKKRAIALLLSLENWIRDAAENFNLGSVPAEIYACGDGRVIRHSSGSWPPPSGFPLPDQIPPRPEHIQKAVQPFLDADERAHHTAESPKKLKGMAKPAGSAKRSRKRAA